MKKILAILLVVVVITAITVPAFATEPGYIIYGDYEFPDIDDVWEPQGKLNYPYAYIFGTSTDAVLFLSDTKHVVISGTYGDTFQSEKNATKILKFKISESGTWVRDNWYTDNKLSSYTLSYLSWASYDIGYKYGYKDGIAYHTVAPFDPNAICDGSTCPATDINFDDVCDDCGMTLAYGLRVTPTTYEFVIKHSDTLTLKYTYTETIDNTVINAVYDDNRITVSFDHPMNHYQYKLVDGEWEEYATYPNTSDSHAMSLSDTALILSADVVVYDVNGDVFFRNPLWMVMGQVTQGAMETLTSEMGGTMKILVVCGVGLMACLVVLSLFGKKSLISLRR